MMTGYEALRSAAAWIDLSDRGKLRVTGEDRARLLHAMSTNDVQALTPNSGVYAFFLSAVGRILADAYIYNLGDYVLLDTEPETRRKLAEHLDKYIIADDAAIEDITAEWVCIGLEGPQSLEVGIQLQIPAPSDAYATLSYRDGFVARLASAGKQGIRIFVPAASGKLLIELLQGADIRQATSAEARAVRIENGIPRYGDDISERYLVQETQQVHAVHTNKGCYLGQEIVERVRSRGQVHRLLTPVRILTTTPPMPGTKLLAGTEPAGEITSAEFSPALNRVVGFAYIRTEAAHKRPELTVADSKPSVTALIV